MAGVIRFGGAGLISLLAVCAAAPALAAEPESAPRYEMERVDGGFLRLDRQTGEMSHCREIQGAWVCQLVPDERKAYEKRLGELENKNADLRKRLNDKGAEAELPSEEELDKAFSFFGSFMDRFAELARDFRDRMRNMDEPSAPAPQSDDI
ncbi:hypothetical protein [Parvibaculum sp. MBR-TMA-1.3b-4.2]|jgi:hypothetical protein